MARCPIASTTPTCATCGVSLARGSHGEVRRVRHRDEEAHADQHRRRDRHGDSGPFQGSPHGHLDVCAGSRPTGRNGPPFIVSPLTTCLGARSAASPFAATECPLSGRHVMSGVVKGFGCRPLRAGSDRAEGRRPKASRGGSRGPGPCAMGISRRGVVCGIVRGAGRRRDAPTGMPASRFWLRLRSIRDRRNLHFRHRAEQDRPLSG